MEAKERLRAVRKARYERLKAQGLCPTCGDPAGPGVFCLRHTELSRKRSSKYREDVLAHYGDKCACCGEDNPAFLCLDHINNDGAKHRREIGLGLTGAGTTMYKWLKRNGYPTGFQVLCYNCNCAKAHNNGICPHKEN